MQILTASTARETAVHAAMAHGILDLVFWHDALLPTFVRLLGPVNTWRLQGLGRAVPCSVCELQPKKL